MGTVIPKPGLAGGPAFSPTAHQPTLLREPTDRVYLEEISALGGMGRPRHPEKGQVGKRGSKCFPGFPVSEVDMLVDGVMSCGRLADCMRIKKFHHRNMTDVARRLKSAPRLSTLGLGQPSFVQHELGSRGDVTIEDGTFPTLTMTPTLGGGGINRQA